MTTTTTTSSPPIKPARAPFRWLRRLAASLRADRAGPSLVAAADAAARQATDDPVEGPDVLAKRRAEAFAPVLLADREFALKERAAARTRLTNAHAARVAKAKAKATKTEPPDPPTELNVTREMGEALFQHAFMLARGFADGAAFVDAYLRAQRKEREAREAERMAAEAAAEPTHA